MSSILIFVVTIIITTFNFLIPAKSSLIQIWKLFLFIYLVSAFVFFISLTFRRLHDMRRPGWLCIIYFLPIIDTAYFLILCFYPVRNSENQYCEIPKPEINLITILGR